MKVEAIRAIIQSEILNEPDFEIEADQDLLLSEILDSLRVTLLIQHLESSCDVTIPPEDVTLENFSTLECIADYLVRLRGD
jgi:acyl carrier protein